MWKLIFRKWSEAFDFELSLFQAQFLLTKNSDQISNLYFKSFKSIGKLGKLGKKKKINETSIKYLIFKLRTKKDGKNSTKITSQFWNGCLWNERLVFE